MRLAHRFNWHYAPPIYPEGDTQLWCKWCGFRQTVKSNPPRIHDAIEKLIPSTSEHPAIFVQPDGKLVAGRKMEEGFDWAALARLRKM